MKNLLDMIDMSDSKEPKESEKRLKSLWKAYRKDLCIYAVIFVISFFLIPTYIAEGVKVDGESMERTLQNYDRLVAEKITTQFGTIERFDIVIFNPHNSVDKYWIKRIIALPGETIQIIGENIYINDVLLEEHYGKDPIEEPCLAKEPITLGEDEYFVLADNRSIGSDSRFIGPIKKEDIEGRACFRLWPFTEFGILN